MFTFLCVPLIYYWGLLFFVGYHACEVENHPTLTLCWYQRLLNFQKNQKELDFEFICQHVEGVTMKSTEFGDLNLSDTNVQV